MNTVNTVTTSLTRGLCLGLLACVFTAPTVAQDADSVLLVEDIEHALWHEPVEIVQAEPAQGGGDGTQTALLQRGEAPSLRVKVRPAPRGGEAADNQPRYEAAAYQVQQLFLDPAQYVVPPTALRSLPLDAYQAFDPYGEPTFPNTASVLFVLQYRLDAVSDDRPFDATRFEKDPVYARHLGHLNIFTYLIKHNDSRRGNIVIAEDPADPRLFSVENSMAFDAPDSPSYGHIWRRLRVTRLPNDAIERLRSVTLDDVREALAVIVQYRIEEGQLVPMEPTDNFNIRQGVRRADDMIQLGLTEKEIRDLYTRVEELLRLVDIGRIETF